MLSVNMKPDLTHSRLNLNYSLQQLENISGQLDFIAEARVNSRDFMVCFVENLPFPCWIKAIDGTMMFISPAYQALYEVKVDEYVGKKDVDVWGEKVAELFKKNDDKVIAGGTVEYTVELVPNRHNPDKIANHCILAKFPIYDGPDIVAVGGIIIAVFPMPD